MRKHAGIYRLSTGGITYTVGDGKRCPRRDTLENMFVVQRVYPSIQDLEKSVILLMPEEML